MKICTLKKYSLIIILVILTILFVGEIIYLIMHNHNKSTVIDSFNVCDDYTFENRNEFLKAQFKKKKLIALTFDDGPSKYTKELVNGLKARDTVATFFVLGQNAESKKDILQYTFDSLNEIGVHSYVHKLFTKLKEEEILEQIDKTKVIIYSATAKEATLIRVPYGAITKHVEETLENTQLSSVLWTIDSKDWKLKNTNKIYTKVMKNIKGNDIILMHDCYFTSVEAALRIVDSLKAKCYTFVTVSELNAQKAESML